MISRELFPPACAIGSLEISLGLVASDSQRFYPKADIATGIEDNWQERRLHIRMNPSDGIPYATFSDGHRPFQLFTRWYGFAVSFPSCSIYHAGAHRPVR
jgi:hypothetical protein